MSSSWAYTYDIGGMLGLELRRALLLKHSRALKNCVDIILSTAALIFLGCNFATIWSAFRNLDTPMLCVGVVHCA